MVKVLLLGHVPDTAAWHTALSRVVELNRGKHGPFDVVLCVGADEHMPPAVTAPPGEVGSWPAVLYPFQRFAMRTVGGGLRVAFLPRDGGAVSGDLQDVHDVDVVVSTDAPRGVVRGSAAPPPGPNAEGLGTEKCAALMEALGRTAPPRYHFAGGLGNAFWQREPYMNPARKRTTRFVALAPVGTPNAKWVHALNIDLTATPSQADMEKDLQAATPFPYGDHGVASTAAASSSSSSSSTAFTFNTAPPPLPAVVSGLLPPTFASMLLAPSETTTKARSQKKRPAASAAVREKGGRGGKRGSVVAKPRPPPRLDCWFCVASPSFENHLVVWLGEHVYVALPKGGLNPSHALVVPIGHETTLRALDGDAMGELAMIVGCLERVYAQRGFVLLGTERALKLSKAPQRHAFLECIPLPVSVLGGVEAAVLAQGKMHKLEEWTWLCSTPGASSHLNNLLALQAMKMTKAAEGEAEAEAEYLFVELPGGKCAVHEATTPLSEGGVPIPLAFGRLVYCHLTNAPRLGNWKDCVQAKDVEKTWAEDLRKALEEVEEEAEDD